jgi:hypothetical protein
MINRIYIPAKIYSLSSHFFVGWKTVQMTIRSAFITTMVAPKREAIYHVPGSALLGKEARETYKAYSGEKWYRLIGGSIPNTSKIYNLKNANRLIGEATYR